jgi:hypothetical protein
VARKRKSALERAIKQASGVRMPSASVSSAKPRFGAKELVDSGTRDRTISRWNRLQAKGIKVPGVTQKNIDTGLAARRVKQTLADSRPTLHTGPPTPRAPGRRVGPGPGPGPRVGPPEQSPLNAEIRKAERREKDKLRKRATRVRRPRSSPGPGVYRV